MSLIISACVFRLTLRVLVLSDYGKLSALAAMIWSEDFYLWLPLALVALSQFQAMNGDVLIIQDTMLFVPSGHH